MDKDNPYYYSNIDTARTNEGGLLATMFVLWHGIVEDIADPLLLSRVKVRAIGYHNSDRAKMPTDTLPWAMPIIPSTGATGTSRFDVGDWVTGYFLDGYDAQKPVILGKFEGVNPKNLFYQRNIEDINSDLITPERTPPRNFKEFLQVAGRNNITKTELTPEQVKILQHQPKPAAGIFTQLVGRPSIPTLAQNLINGTSVAAANKNRVHVCDISLSMRVTAELTKTLLSLLARGIRAAVKKILGLLGISLDSESARFIELAKKIKRGIDYIRSFIDTINNYAKFVVIYAQQVRAMIDWILSLPKSLAALLAECLNELLNSASAGFSQLIASSLGLEDNPLKDVAEIIDSSQKLINSTATLLNVPGQVVEALATPSTPQAQAAAANNILSFTSSFSTVKTPTTPTLP